MYGYKIINGRAEIDEAEAAVIIDIFNGYISGLSMKAAAESAGVPIAHSTVKKLLSRTAYIGDDYYPPIISRETFAKANARRIHRSDMYNREKRYCPPQGCKEFSLSEPTKQFNDPAEQAEYIYSLIEVKT